MPTPPLALIDLDHTLLNTTHIKIDYRTLASAVEAFSHFTGNEVDRYLYPDTIAFINYIKKYFIPAIFTEGPVDFQKAKISHSALAGLIDNNCRFVFDGFTKSDQLSQLVALHHPKLMVDDNPKNLEAAHHLNLITVRVKRGDHRADPDIATPDLTVASLQEIVEKDLFATFIIKI